MMQEKSSEKIDGNYEKSNLFNIKFSDNII